MTCGCHQAVNRFFNRDDAVICCRQVRWSGMSETRTDVHRWTVYVSSNSVSFQLRSGVRIGLGHVSEPMQSRPGRLCRWYGCRNRTQRTLHRGWLWRYSVQLHFSVILRPFHVSKVTPSSSTKFCVNVVCSNLVKQPLECCNVRIIGLMSCVPCFEHGACPHRHNHRGLRFYKCVADYMAGGVFWTLIIRESRRMYVVASFCTLEILSIDEKEQDSIFFILNRRVASAAH